MPLLALRRFCAASAFMATTPFPGSPGKSVPAVKCKAQIHEVSGRTQKASGRAKVKSFQAAEQKLRVMSHHGAHLVEQ